MPPPPQRATPPPGPGPPPPAAPPAPPAAPRPEAPPPAAGPGLARLVGLHGLQTPRRDHPMSPHRRRGYRSELTAPAGYRRDVRGVRQAVAHRVGDRGIGLRRDHQDGQP